MKYIYITDMGGGGGGPRPRLNCIRSFSLTLSIAKYHINNKRQVTRLLHDECVIVVPSTLTHTFVPVLN